MGFHEVQDSITGTPEGSIVSPLLANIYLHELDVFVEDMKSNYDKGVVSSRNPEYRKLEHLRLKANKVGDLKLGVKYLKEMQLIKSHLPYEPDFRRMYYVRHANNFVLAIRGPHSDAVNVLQRIREMLSDSLKLDLSVEKSKITNPRKEPALFLGTLISISNYICSATGKNHQRIRVVSHLRFLAPMGIIFKKLTLASFMSARYKSGIPKFI